MNVKPRSIGWLGTGRMGAAMAARLIDAGEDVTVWNRTRSKTGPLVARGARAVERIADLSSCDVVFVMVSTPDDLEEVVCGEHGLLSGYRTRADRTRADLAGADLAGADLAGADLSGPDQAGTDFSRADQAGAGRGPGVIVDCSTVSVETSARVRAAVNAAGADFLAAPVSGNPHVVAEGGCCIIASGPAEVFGRVRPHLEAIAKVAVHAGEEEQSRLVKLCHNLYLGMMVQALAEVTSLAEKGGTDRAAFLEFLGGTVVASDWVRKRTDALVRRDWTPTFTTELLRKDFDLGLDAARSLAVPMPVGALVYQLIQSAIGTGLRHEDFLSLYELQAAGAALHTQHSPEPQRFTETPATSEE
jgi:3-hydroxyisobutyrate dehydrogenase-like beta-hydroxyacid dehydrogenase